MSELLQGVFTRAKNKQDACPPQQTVESASDSGITTQVDLTAAPSVVISANPCRRSVLITNLTANDVWVGFTNGVSDTIGDLIPPVRGAFKSYPYNGNIYGICPSGGRVSIVEVS